MRNSTLLIEINWEIFTNTYSLNFTREIHVS